jgi:beta-galactosidase
MNGKRQCFGRAALLFLVNATLFANAALPEINYPPLNQSVVLYQQAAFGVIASGSSPLAFQWYKNGTPIPGATNDQVVLPNVNFPNEGCFQ